MREIEAHKRTDGQTAKRAKEVAEAASNAKSRHVAGLSHELRTGRSTPSSAMRQILETRQGRSPPRRGRRPSRWCAAAPSHLSGLIDGLLDIFQDREAGRFPPSIATRCVSATSSISLSTCFRLQAHAKGPGISFRSRPQQLPAVVHTDESRPAADPDQPPLQRPSSSPTAGSGDVCAFR